MYRVSVTAMIPLELRDSVDLAMQVAGGKLRLLCRDMCLAPATTNDPNGAALRGAGIVESTRKGGLLYRLVLAEGLPVSHYRDLSAEPARVEHIDELYRLVAVDSAGREWRSTPVRGRFSGLVNHSRSKEIGEPLDAIMHREMGVDVASPSVVLIFPKPPEMRLALSGWTRKTYSRSESEVSFEDSLDHAEYHVEKCRVRLELERDGPLVVIVEAEDMEMVPLGFDQRFLDTMAFVFGRRFSPSLTLRTQAGHRDWCVSRGYYLDPVGMIRPPVLPIPEKGREGVLSLAVKYQEAIAVHWPDAFAMHDPLSEALSEIALGSQGTLRSASLALGVGIEGVSKVTNLQRRYAGVAGNLDADSAIQYLDDWSGDATTKQWAIQRLREGRGPSLASCLYAFATAKGFSHGVVDTWKRVRPKMAHGTPGAQKPQRPDDERDQIQLGVDAYYAMLELVYRLVADFIGFEGELMRYAEPDWGLDEGVVF